MSSMDKKWDLFRYSIENNTSQGEKSALFGTEGDGIVLCQVILAAFQPAAGDGGLQSHVGAKGLGANYEGQNCDQGRW